MPTTTQTDTANEFDWDIIETITNPDGSLFRIKTTFDTGLIQTDYYSGGALSSSNEDDSASQLYDWTTRSFSYDAAGILTNTSVTFDDGTSRFETYVDGILNTVIENDWGDVNQHSWDRIQSSYDETGTLYRQLTRYDDTSIKTEYFAANGQRTTSQITDTTDNAANWDMIQTNYDTTTGLIDLRITNYDDGVKRYDDYENGVRTEVRFDDRDDVKTYDTIIITYDNSGGAQKVTTYDNGMVQTDVRLQDGRFQNVEKIDVNDAYSWEKIETSFNDAAILETVKVTTYDNGSIREDYTRDGLRTESRQFDTFEGEGAYGWNAIETFYDENGAMAFRDTEYDNGTRKTEEYNDGALSRVVLTDENGAQNYDTITTYYDLGAVAYRETVYDSGVTRAEEYLDGTRERTTETDSAADVKNFETKTTYYDENGDLVYRETNFDSGVVRMEEFDAGTRSRTTEEDRENTANYEDRSTFYDENGVIVFREQNFDNGVQRLEQFENGNRLTLTEEDRADTATWTSRGTYFDAETGQIIQKGEERDNGVSIVETYQDGVRNTRINDDLADTFVWETKSTQYDETGARAHTFTGFDNGDALIDVFDTGTRDFRLERDGDDSQSWAYRVTEYDENGQNAQRTTYDTAEDVPAAYQDTLMLIDGWSNGAGF